MGQGNIGHRENNDKMRPRRENQINKKSNKSDINGEDKESTLMVTSTQTHTQFEMCFKKIF